MVDSIGKEDIPDYHWHHIHKSLHPKRKRRPFVILFFIGIAVLLIAYAVLKNNDSDLLMTKPNEGTSFASTFQSKELSTEPYTEIFATSTPLNASPNEIENAININEIEKVIGLDVTPDEVKEQKDELPTDRMRYISVDSSGSVLDLLEYSNSLVPGELLIVEKPKIFPEIIAVQRKNEHHLEVAGEAGFVYYDFRPNKSDAWNVQNINAGPKIGANRLSYSLLAAYNFELQHQFDIQIYAIGSVVAKKYSYSMYKETYKEIFSDGNQSRYTMEEEVQNRVYNESLYLGGIGVGLEKRWKSFSILVGGGIETSTNGIMGSNIKAEIGKDVKFEISNLRIYTFYRQSFQDKPYSTDEVFITPHQIGIGIKKRL